MLHLIFSTVLLLFLLVAAPATADDQKLCHIDNQSPDSLITACTRLIGSRKLKGANLVYAHNNRGIGFERRGDVQRALADYARALQLDPKYIGARMNRARVLMEEDENEKAIADLEEVLRLDPDHAQARMALDIASLAKGLDDSIEALKGEPGREDDDTDKQSDQAQRGPLEAFRAAAEVLKGPPPPDRVLSGVDEITWNLIKDTDDLGTLRAFVQQFPESPLRKAADARILALLGPDEIVWALIKDSTDAGPLRAFAQQFPDSPLRKEAEARIAALAGGATAPVQAAVTSAQAKPAAPKADARPVQMKDIRDCDGVVEEEDQDIWTDEEACTRIIESSNATTEQRIKAYLQRGSAVRAKYSEAAITDLTIVINHDPRRLRAYDRRGDRYKVVGQFDLAIADYTKMIELNLDKTYSDKNNEYLDLSFSYRSRGLAYATMKNWKAALDDFTKALEAGPKPAWRHDLLIFRGLALTRQKQYDSAIAAFTQAIQLRPKDGGAYLGRSIAYRQKRDNARAAVDERSYRRYDPRKSSFIHYWLKD